MLSDGQESGFTSQRKETRCILCNRLLVKVGRCSAETQIAVEKNLPWQRKQLRRLPQGPQQLVVSPGSPPPSPSPFISGECDSPGFELLAQLFLHTWSRSEPFHLTLNKEQWRGRSHFFLSLNVSNFCVERILYVAKSSFQTGQTLLININIPIVFQKGHSLMDQ